MSRKALLIVDHDRSAVRRVSAALSTVTDQAIEGTTPEHAMVRLRIHEYASVLLCGSLTVRERSELWIQISQHATPPRVVCIGGPNNARPYSHYTVFQPLLLPSMPEPTALARSLRLKLMEAANHRQQTAMSLRLVGKSEAVLDIRRMIERHSETGTPVLIMGEPGTGKRLIGRQIHDASDRRNAPFVSVDCAALEPDTALEVLVGSEDAAASMSGGKLAEGRGGTLLLRNLAALPLEAQEALAEIMASWRNAAPGAITPAAPHTRIVATTGNDLRDTAGRRPFCNRLHRQLDGFVIHVPPLRERQEDIPLMVAHVSCAMRQRSGADIRFSGAAMQAIKTYNWPGNQQQLLTLLQKLAALRKQRVIDITDLPARIRESATGQRLPEGTAPPAPASTRFEAAAVRTPRRGVTRTEPSGVGLRRLFNRTGLAAKSAG